MLIAVPDPFTPYVKQISIKGSKAWYMIAKDTVALLPTWAKKSGCATLMFALSSDEIRKSL